MRKFKFFAMLLIIFLLSGCGGSIDNDTNTNTNTNTNNSDRYNAANVLSGTWTAIEEADVTADLNTDKLVMNLLSANLYFSNVIINGNTGSAIVSSSQTWRAIVNNAAARNSSIFDFTDKVVNLSRYGRDQWRGEIPDEEGHEIIFIITINSESNIHVVQNGIIPMPYNLESDITFYDDYGASYYVLFYTTEIDYVK